jgi:hypothetical protein
MKRVCGRSARAALVAAAVIAVATGAGAQTFGQFTTAAISPPGEGAFFLTGGSGQARAGIAARFEFSEHGDAGLQFGYDRAENVDSYGIGVDYKRYLISSEGTVPIDLAGDLSYGFLSGSGFSRSLFGMSVIISGVVPAEIPIGFEPYGSIGFIGTWFHHRGACDIRRPGSWPCRADDASTDSGLLLRGGVKIRLNDEFQVYVEVKYDDTASLGMAMNVVF